MQPPPPPFLQSIDFQWLSTRATFKDPIGGCGLSKADRLRASYCWFSSSVRCNHCWSPSWSPVSWVEAGGNTDVELNHWYWNKWWFLLFLATAKVLLFITRTDFYQKHNRKHHKLFITIIWREDSSSRGWSWGNNWQCVEGPYSVWLYSHFIWCWIESSMTLRGDRMAGTFHG